MSALVREATKADGASIASRIRIRDSMAQIWAKQGRSHEEAVQHTLSLSRVAWTLEIDGVPACMWGVIVDAGRNIAWLLTTDLVERYTHTFWRESRRAVASMVRAFGVIEGFCDAQFYQSVRWLNRLGFMLDWPVVVDGMTIYHFEMREA